MAGGRVGSGVRVGGKVLVGTGVFVGVLVGVGVSVVVEVGVGVKVDVGVHVAGSETAATVGEGSEGRSAAMGFAFGLTNIRPKQRQTTTVRPMTAKVAY